MNKNTVIGFILIGLIFVGFTFYQQHEYKKKVLIQNQIDSINKVKELKARAAEDSLKALTHVPDFEENAVVHIYKDSLLENSSKKEGTILTLKNKKVEIELSTKGAQPYSAKILDYKNYDKTNLYLFKPGSSELGLEIYAGESINTKNFVFDIVEQNDSLVIMRLPFAKGGYIEQKYTLPREGYLLKNTLSFVGMNRVIPKNVSSMNMDWKLTIPRMEKGYRNETQYSNLHFMFKDEDKPESIGGGKSGTKNISNKLSWYSFQQQFFSAILYSKEDFTGGDFSIDFASETDSLHNLMTCHAQTRTEVDFSSSSDLRLDYEYYFGPNHYKTLKTFGRNYEKIIPTGGHIIGWFTKFIIIPLFNFLYEYISNFGIIILLMTIFIKIVVLPFAYKSYSSSAKMQILRPEIEKINAKYPNQNDAVKKQQATMELYKRAGVNPLGGCLPMLFQLPILWAFYKFFPASIELRQQSFLWADDLSSYDSIFNFGFSLPLIGDHLSLFSLLMAVSMFLYSRISTGSQMAGNDPNAKMMSFMSIWMMPIMMFFICNNLSSGLSYYYLLSNLITMGETVVIKKYFVHPEKIYARLKATEGKPIQKSKWQLRLEEAQRMQEQMRKNKR